MNSKFEELLILLQENPVGESLAKDLKLPYKDENFNIYEKDAKIFIETSSGKISYFFTSSNYISHFELLKRILVWFGVEIKEEDAKNYLKIKVAVAEILKGERKCKL